MKRKNNIGVAVGIMLAIIITFGLAFLPLYTLTSGFMRATGGL